MPLAFYICAGITALLLIFILAKISSHLASIQGDLSYNLRHMQDALQGFLKWSGAKESKPTKHREYWRDQNGFRHWRKRKDA